MRALPRYVLYEATRIKIEPLAGIPGIFDKSKLRSPSFLIPPKRQPFSTFPANTTTSSDVPFTIERLPASLLKLTFFAFSSTVLPEFFEVLAQPVTNDSASTAAIPKIIFFFIFRSSCFTELELSRRPYSVRPLQCPWTFRSLCCQIQLRGGRFLPKILRLR